MSANASELFQSMLCDVKSHHHTRKSEDPSSPLQCDTYEAKPGRSYDLYAPHHNFIDVRPVEKRWAIASVLHFFAGTEEASMLKKYNGKQYDRFVGPDGQWKGAYGFIAVPQIERCIALLTERPTSRRAIVDMGPLEVEDINRPACWNTLQFLIGRDGLHMCVYQRSCNLFGVMPYDAILLGNILIYVARKLGVKPYEMHWAFGSLHMRTDEVVGAPLVPRLSGIVVPSHILEDKVECLRRLESEELFA